jgi:hypothetical protein
MALFAVILGRPGDWKLFLDYWISVVKSCNGRKQLTEFAPSEAVSEKVPSITGTQWMDGYGIMSGPVEVLKKFPPNASLDCHLFHHFFLGCIRKHKMLVKCRICDLSIVSRAMIESRFSTWERSIFDCSKLVHSKWVVSGPTEMTPYSSFYEPILPFFILV